MKKNYKPELNTKYFIDPYCNRGGGFNATINSISDKDVSYSTEDGLALRCSIQEWKII
ncbi:MAG: hypothetical protein KAT04_14480 [Methylococcales bacterium]|nr:hypothetical protein [Methylococcales bacterium]